MSADMGMEDVSAEELITIAAVRLLIREGISIGRGLWIVLSKAMTALSEDIDQIKEGCSVRRCPAVKAATTMNRCDSV